MRRREVLKRMPDIILLCSVGVLLVTLGYAAFTMNKKNTVTKQDPQGKTNTNNVASVPDLERAKALEEAQRTGNTSTYDYTTDTIPLPMVGSM